MNSALQKSVSALLFWVAWSWSLAAWGAEVTRVASSFEPERRLGLLLDVGLNRRQEDGTIFREGYDGQRLTTSPELAFSQLDTEMKFDVHLGVFRGLEFHFGLPIVFQQDRTFTQLASPENTSVTRICGDARGLGCDTPGNGSESLYALPTPTSRSYLSGLGDVSFGLGWAVFRQEKDDTRPTWVIRFDYTAPSAIRNTPSQPTSPQSRGNIGEQVHRLTFATAVSRRFQVVEPYFHLEYVAPIASPSIYSNCDEPTSGRIGFGQNCGTGVWSRRETGMKPSHTLTAAFGSEFHLYENASAAQRLLIDARGFVTGLSASRSFNAMSPLLGKLLASDAYASGGLKLSLLGQAGDFLQLKLSASLAAVSERFLTNEAPGLDIDTNGQVDLSAQTAESAAEVNPNYDARVDRVGRRFRMHDAVVFEVNATATFRF